MDRSTKRLLEDLDKIVFEHPKIKQVALTPKQFELIARAWRDRPDFPGLEQNLIYDNPDYIYRGVRLYRIDDAA